jgi:hypothetical protein
MELPLLLIRRMTVPPPTDRDPTFWHMWRRACGTPDQAGLARVMGFLQPMPPASMLDAVAAAARTVHFSRASCRRIAIVKQPFHHFWIPSEERFDLFRILSGLILCGILQVHPARDRRFVIMQSFRQAGRLGLHVIDNGCGGDVSGTLRERLARIRERGERAASRQGWHIDTISMPGRGTVATLLMDPWRREGSFPPVDRAIAGGMMAFPGGAGPVAISGNISASVRTFARLSGGVIR